MRRTPLKRHRPTTGRRFTADKALASRAFRLAVTAPGACVVCGARGPLDAHHIVRAQTMRRHGLTLDEIYHPLAGIAVCRACHSRHHAFVARMPRGVVPPESVEFLVAVGLGAALDREYPPGRAAA